jgi:carbonic anhydrase
MAACPDDEYSHFHLGLNSLLHHILRGKEHIAEDEAKAMKSAQQPDAFLICCIDSRFQPDKALDYGPGVALEYRPIAAVVPPPAEADEALLARMAFRRLKDVRNIIIVAHSDCGGAQASINLPNPDPKGGGDLDLVARETHRTGLDVPKLSAEFLKASGGDARAAGNLLAREVAVQSYKNLLEYKGRDGFATIADEVKAGEAKIALLYYDLETLSVEQYDLAKGAWVPVTPPDSPPPPATKPLHRPVPPGP